MILAEVEAFFDWHNDVMRHCMFPATQPRPRDTMAPSNILAWCKENQALEPSVLERLTKSHDDICAITTKMLEQAQTGQPPKLEHYDVFEALGEAFIADMRRLQQDMSNSSMAVDPVTGLRTVAGMKNDIKREHDRFDRKGTAFSVACIVIDNLDELNKQLDRKQLDAIYAASGKYIARTIRSFDDAYYMGKGEYIVVLKHIDFKDACIVIDRIKSDFEKTPIVLPGDKEIRITASLGLAEAISRESEEDTIAHARTAMRDSQSKGGNRVMIFEEVSPLQKIAKQMAENR